MNFRVTTARLPNNDVDTEIMIPAGKRSRDALPVRLEELRRHRHEASSL